MSTRDRDAMNRLIGGALALGWRGAIVQQLDETQAVVVLFHPLVGVWWVRVAHDRSPEFADSETWVDLIRAGAVVRTLHVPSGLDAFMQDLRDVTATHLEESPGSGEAP